jgi:hypothetical protein
MEGGGNFYPNASYEQGYPSNQGFLLLPFPGTTDKKVF